MQRRRLVLRISLICVVVLSIWLILLPYLYPVYYAVEITLEEENVLYMSFKLNQEDIKAILPSMTNARSQYVYLRVGLGHLSILGREYDYVFASFYTYISSLPVGPSHPRGSTYPYVLAFFTNNSELGNLLNSYGFPHSYVEAIYSYGSDSSMNRTLLSMNYPNETPLLKISAITPRVTEDIDYNSPETLYYHLNGNNLTIFYLSQISNPYRIPYHLRKDAHVNVTFLEESEPWKYTGMIGIATKKDVSNIPVTYNVGRIGWIVWR